MTSRRELLFGVFLRQKPSPEKASASDSIVAQGPQIIKFAEHCLAFQNVVCRSCADACEPAAIRFTPRIGGAAQPMLIAARCTGCGECVTVCPASALDLVSALPTQNNHQETVT